ncbi:MAG: hypothetical protein RLZZ234_705 [Candidatus Parcubacteria bacterium]|jgi:hypothetical protein
MEERSGAVSTDSYILKDHLGSTHIVANKQGNAVQTLEYHPYGEVQSE